MTDKEKIREEVEKRYEYWKEKESNSHSIESEIRMSECQHLLLMLNSLQEEHVSIWHDASEMPKEKKVCLIRYSANDGASTNNFEVVIAEPLTRRFVTRSYPHKTGYQHTIHGETTINVDEYQDRREKIPFSDIDEWAYIDDILNLSNVEKAIKNWKEEPVSENLELTWEDIPEIFRISEQLKTSWWFRDNEQTKQIGTQVFWEEVLKRFKERKENAKVNV